MPLGLKAWFAERGITNVVELDWWQSHKLGEVEVVLTPVQHWSGRSLGDRMETLWGGYALFAPDLHVFFAGDTGYSKDFADIRARFAERQGGARAAASTSRCCRSAPTSRAGSCRSSTSTPKRRCASTSTSAPRRSLGIHWGTFELTDESLDEPPRKLAEARQALQRIRRRVLHAGGRRRRAACRRVGRAEGAFACGESVQVRATSSCIQACVVSPLPSAISPWPIGSSLRMALLTWLTGSTQK